jgi:hypothetical protein
MTIKQQGGIFGRNPSFNDVDVNDITVSGSATTGDASLNGAVIINDAGADKDFRVESDANTHMIFVDAGNNRLAINKNDPACLVEMFDGTAAGTHEILRLSTWSGSNIKRVKVSIDSNEGTAGIIYDADKSGGATPDHIFKQAGSEVGRFKSTGIAFPSGKGIDFSATSGTGTSELFSDYEEGVWSPASGVGTATGVSGVYTKIGRQVSVIGTITFPVQTNAGLATITGLPFTSGTTGSGGTLRYTNFGSAFFLYGAPSTTTINCFNTAGAGITYTTISGKRVDFAMTYFV